MPEPSNDQFQWVLAIAESQFKRGKIAVRFGPFGKTRFIIDEPQLRDTLSGSGIDEATFRSIFYNEVGPLLEAVIQGTVDQYIDTAVIRSLGAKDQRDARKVLTRERANMVEKALATPELRARYVIKISSKHSILKRSTWEVAKKTQLSTKEPWLLPYATLSFETIAPAESVMPMFSFISLESISRTEVSAFDCDEGDLDDLIDSLQEAKAALRRARGGTA